MMKPISSDTHILAHRRQHLWRLSLKRILILGAIVPLTIATLSSCGAVPGFAPHATPVAEITPETSTGKRVYVRGKVVTIAPFIDGGAYQLQDETGAIWVRTDADLPAMGTTVFIAGEIGNEAIAIGQHDFGEVYIIEREQLETDD